MHVKGGGGDEEAVSDWVDMHERGKREEEAVSDWVDMPECLLVV